MHPHLEAVFTSLDASREELRRAVDAIAPANRTTRPEPTRWSAAEVIEHVARVESRFAGQLRDRIAEARGAGLAEERTDRLPLPPVIAMFLGDRSNRRTAPEPVAPQAGIDEATAWAAADRSREELRSVVAAADGLAL